jgi:DNA-binding TFAR19-related protein (PDSD5 family)
LTEEDKELEFLKAKRMLEMQKNISQRLKAEETKVESKTSPDSPRDLVLKHLGYRGEEVLQNAEYQFPEETKSVVEKLAELIKGGEVIEIIDGGKLLTLFRSLGIRVRLQTTISIEQDGKLVSWSDKLKGDIKLESEKSSNSTTDSSTDTTNESPTEYPSSDPAINTSDSSNEIL